MAAVTKDGPVPMFLQIERELAEEIQRNIYRPGERLPSEQALSQRFHVHRLTVRKALNRLQERDMVVRYQGKGTYVKPPALTVALNPHEGFYSSLVRSGTTPIKKLLSFDLCASTDEIRAALDLHESTSLYCLRRLYHTENGHTPIALTESYFRPEFQYTVEQANELVVYQLLEQLSGYTVSTSNYTIATQSATPEEAKHLRISLGYPLLMLRRQSLDPTGLPLEYTRIRLVSDLYRVYITFQAASGITTPFFTESPFLTGNPLVINVGNSTSQA